MKKFILAVTLLLSLTSINDVFAQNFSFTKDTVKGVASDNGLELHNDVKNLTSNTYKINWKIISHNIPAAPSKWNTNFGLCDNKLCYSNNILGGTTQTSVDVAGNGTMDLKISIADLAGVTAFGPFYVNVELTQGTTVDTCTFIMNKWSTNVNNLATKATDNIVVYPNPARDDLNVVFNGMNEVKSIGIYNLIGKMVSVYKVSGNSAKLNVENIPSGIYLMRLMDAQGHVVAVRKFNHQ